MIAPDPAQLYVRFHHLSMEVRPGGGQQTMLFREGFEGFLFAGVMVRRIDLQAFQAIIDQLPDVFFPGIRRVGQDGGSPQFFYLSNGADGGDIFHGYETWFPTPQVIAVEADVGGTGSVAVDVWPKPGIVAIFLPAEDGFQE